MNVSAILVLQLLVLVEKKVGQVLVRHDGFLPKQLAQSVTETNRTLGRALDPRANGTWLSKLTE